MKKKVIIITGPTASGKSEAALILAKAVNGTIICMDSMQIYRGMDIGTAKPTAEEQSICPHRMFDVASPFENYSAARYASEAQEWVDRTEFPILVGGTGLFLNAISTDMEFGYAVSDPKIREKYENIAKNEGNEYLHSLLEKADPLSALRLHPNDTRRVIRALEVLELTGKPFSSQKATDPYRTKEGYDYRIFAFSRERSALYARIDKRVDIMMQAGLENEVEHLICDLGVPDTTQSMQGIGYKELIPVLRGEQTKENAVSLIKQRSRNYAKRQLTWFRRDPRVHWIDANSTEPAEAAKLIQRSSENKEGETPWTQND